MKRNHNLDIRVSKEEKEKIKSKVQDLGISLAKYIRELALGIKFEGEEKI